MAEHVNQSEESKEEAPSQQEGEETGATNEGKASTVQCHVEDETVEKSPTDTMKRHNAAQSSKAASKEEAAGEEKEGLLDAREVAYRYDIVLWLFGMLFLCVLFALMFGIGAIREWDAQSPYFHNSSANSEERFLPEPFTPEPNVYKRSDKDASSRWYYWKLKPELVTAWTKLFVWAGYILHNLSIWLVLYLQHKAKSFPDKDGKYASKFSTTPDRYNLIMFGLNIFFHLLHLLNTHTTYDGTAADTSEASSQSSVIVAIIIMLFIEFKDRGVLFGYPSPYQLRKYRDSVWMSPVYLMRKYHGYFIYWAAIYTFWYHPMENTIGHATGFAHTWFFMLQGSLTFTKLHLNKYWRFILEIWVTIHSGVVAVQTVPNIMGKELWPMFVFGFSTAIVLTQLYGLPFWKSIPSWTRAIPVAIYTVILLTAYNFIRDTQGRKFTRLAEIIRIPGIYYLLMLVAWLIIVAIAKVKKIREVKVTHSAMSSQKSFASAQTEKAPESPRPPIAKEILLLSATILTYAFSVFLSWILEYLDMQVNLIVLTMIYCFSFMVLGAILGFFFLSGVIPLNRYAVLSK